jgi:hypothetical protein
MSILVLFVCFEIEYHYPSDTQSKLASNSQSSHLSFPN